MGRKHRLATLAGLGAALILAGTAAGYAAAGNPPPPPPPAHPMDDAPPHHMGGPGAGPGFMMPGLWAPQMLEHIGTKLGLTPEQHQAIKDALDAARPKFDALHHQMRADIELLAKTRPDDAAYQGVVASASQSASQNAAQMVLQGSQLRSQIYGVLTPAQKEQLVKLEAEHHAHMEKMEHMSPQERMEHMHHMEPGDHPPPPMPH